MNEHPGIPESYGIGKTDFSRNLHLVWAKTVTRETAGDWIRAWSWMPWVAIVLNWSLTDQTKTQKRRVPWGEPLEAREELAKARTPGQGLQGIPAQQLRCMPKSSHSECGSPLPPFPSGNLKLTMHNSVQWANTFPLGLNQVLLWFAIICNWEIVNSYTVYLLYAQQCVGYIHVHTEA